MKPNPEVLTQLENKVHCHRSARPRFCLVGGLKSCRGIFIERDTVVSSNIKLGQGKNSLVALKDYHVLGLYDKSYNKWFMTGEKKEWKSTMKTKEKKKYKLAVRMIEDGTLNNYDDICLSNDRYNKKDICKIISGNAIEVVKGSHKSSPV
eukprot:12358948-Ditylum_brightwellii.AAC.2